MPQVQTPEEIFNTVFNGVDHCYHFPELKELVILCMTEYKKQDTTNPQKGTGNP